jgi:hypothetical protein
MIIDNDPQITRNISIPKDLSSLSCSSFTAGIVEAVLDGLGFVGDVCFSTGTWLMVFSASPCDCSQHSHTRAPQPHDNSNQAGQVGC